MEQWYAYVPAVDGAVKVLEAPGRMSPVSKAPPLAVSVWVTESVFVTVTFVPGFTVSVTGVKA
jgi:hypothetical protein